MKNIFKFCLLHFNLACEKLKSKPDKVHADWKLLWFFIYLFFILY